MPPPQLNYRPRPALFRMPRWASRFAWFAAVVALSGAAQSTPPAMTPHPILLPEANRPLDANQRMELEENQGKEKSYEAANIERKRQIDEDSAHLLRLAADLHVELDKTGKDTLSLEMIRKAQEIELLAHSVKEKMKLTVGGS